MQNITDTFEVAEVSRPIMTDADIQQAALEEWLDILSRLWTAVGKVPTSEQLALYQETLKDLPLGLLEIAVRRALQEHQFNSVPTIGNVWKAAMRELGTPAGGAIAEAIERWVSMRFESIVFRF